MSEIREFEVVPAKDITDAKFVRYRTTRRTIQEYAILWIQGIRVFVGRKQLSQLFRYLPRKIGEIRFIPDYNDRDREFLKALRSCDKSLMFSVAGDNVIRVVSSDFTAIPHSKVIQLVEKALKLNYEKRDIDFDSGMFAKWTLKSLPQEWNF